jgi:hypothetical protein
MLVPHLRRGCLALGVLLGALVLPGEARASKVPPVQATLEIALTYLNSAVGADLGKATTEVQDALTALGGPTITTRFHSGPGIDVLLNRHRVMQAQRLLKIADQLLAAKKNSPQAQKDVQKALKDIDAFLRLP